MTISLGRMTGKVLLASLLLAFMAGHAPGADNPVGPAAHSGAPQKTLKLFTKNPSTWQIIPNSAKGVLSFNENTGQFTFTAEKLRPRYGYSLVRHDAGETSGDLLGKGVTDQVGGLGLTGVWRLWRGKVWLVPTDHTGQVSGRLRLTAWHPGQILFEEKVLGTVYPCNGKK